MKKIFVFSAALIMLASCAGQSEQKSADTVTADSTTPISQVLTGEEQARLTPDAVLEPEGGQRALRSGQADGP